MSLEYDVRNRSGSSCVTDCTPESWIWGSEGGEVGFPIGRRVRKLKENTYRGEHPMELLAFGGDTLGPRNVWVPTHDNNLIQDWLDESRSPFRRVRVVNLGPREPGVWLDYARQPVSYIVCAREAVK
jgi:hypothetical protein